MACELTHWNSPECLDTLSAAYAEAGDFASAVKWQSRAVQLLPAGDKTRGLRRRLYIEFKRPYRDRSCRWPKARRTAQRCRGQTSGLLAEVTLDHRLELPVDLKAQHRPFSMASAAVQP